MTWLHLYRSDLLHGDVHYMRRYICTTPLGSLRLHITHRPDSSPDPHTHPWPFWSLLLRGWYAHQYTPDIIDSRFHRHTRTAPSLMRFPADAVHRIVAVSGKPAVTLVITPPTSKRWGFYSGEDGFVEFSEYLNLRRFLSVNVDYLRIGGWK